MASPVKVVLQGVDNVTPVLKNIEATAGAVNDALSSLGYAVGAIAIADFFKDAVEEAIKAQKNTRMLQQALIDIGPAALAQMPKINQFLETLSLHSTKNTEELKAAFTQIVAATHDVALAEQILPVALDAAAGSTRGFEQTITMTTRAAEGNTKALHLMGIELKAGETPLQALAERYHGLDEAATDSTTSIKHAAENLLIAIGNLLVETDAWGRHNNILAVSLEKLADLVNGPIRSGLREIIAGFQSLPAQLERAAGTILMLDARILHLVTGPLAHWGIHIGDKLEGALNHAGAVMVSNAENAISHLKDDVNRYESGTTSAPTNVGKGYTGGAIGQPATTKAHYVAPEVTTGSDMIELNKALLQFDDQRQQAFLNLMILSGAYQEQMEDTTLDEKERVEAARMYDQAQAAITEELRRQSEEFQKLQAQLLANQLAQDKAGIEHGGSSRTAALKDLMALRSQYLKIINDTSASLENQRQAEENLQRVYAVGGNVLTKYIADQNFLANTLKDIGKQYGDVLTKGVEDYMVALGKGGSEAQKAAAAEKKAIADASEAAGKKLIGIGIGKLADGIFPPNPLEIASGLAMITAGEALGVAGGAIGGSGGGSGGGGGSGTGYNSTNGISGGRGNVSITFPSTNTVFDPHNPATRAAFQQFCTSLTGNNVPVNLPGVGSQ